MTLKSWIHDEDRGVSPVIGVILMVAITVILAAVIAAFVLDLGQGQSVNAQVGIDISQDGTEVTAQRIDEGNAESIYISATTSADTYWMTSSGGLDASRSNRGSQLSSVGDTVTLETDSSSNGDISNDITTITITAEVDGSENVVQEYEVN